MFSLHAMFTTCFPLKLFTPTGAKILSKTRLAKSHRPTILNISVRAILFTSVHLALFKKECTRSLKRLSMRVQQIFGFCLTHPSAFLPFGIKLCAGRAHQHDRLAGSRSATTAYVRACEGTQAAPLEGKSRVDMFTFVELLLLQVNQSYLLLTAGVRFLSM